MIQQYSPIQTTPYSVNLDLSNQLDALVPTAKRITHAWFDGAEAHFLLDTNRTMRHSSPSQLLSARLESEPSAQLSAVL